MIGKFLLTLIVILMAYGVLRARWRNTDGRADRLSHGAPPHRAEAAQSTMRLAAALLVAIMAVGSALYLVLDWRDARTVVQVQVINANTGQITPYASRRGSIAGRRLVTLDGREIRLADVERMIVLPAAPDRPPQRP